MALAPAASAADSTTPLAGVTQVGDTVAAGGKVYIAAYNRIVVADSTGAIVDHITGLPGAVGLAVSPDGSRLYAAMRDANTVAEIDTGTLAVTGQINLSGYPCPSNLAAAGNVLWVGYGCGQWGGGILGIDVSAATPAPVVIATNMYGAPQVAAAGTVLAAGETGLSPASIEVYDVSGTTATLHGTISGWTYNLSNLQELAITPDGSTVVSAFGAPYQFNAWDTGTLTPVRSYGSSGFAGYPDAVALSADGRYVAGGRSYGTDLTVYDAATAATIFSGGNSAGNTVTEGVAISGSDVFVVLNNGSGQFSLWRAQGATLPGSSVGLTPPSSATALDPVSIAGRLLLSDGTAPGAQTIAVTRQLPDGSTTTLPPVTTATDGTFTITDTPPVSGTVKYTALWDGSPAYRWSSSTTSISVAPHPSSLALSGPATATIGQQIQLTGALDLGGLTPPAGRTIAVSRKLVNNFGTTVTQLPAVSPAADGSFSFTDTPAHGGQYTYTVTWAADAAFAGSQASFTVSVPSRVSRLTGTMQQPAYINQAYTVSGSVVFEVGQCTGPLTLHVTRTVGTGPAKNLPDVTTDAGCGYSLTDTLKSADDVSYTITWDGDAAHDGSAATVTGTVSKQPTTMTASAGLISGSGSSPAKVTVSGSLVGTFTGPLGNPLSLNVVRTNPDGSTTAITGISTDANGDFTFNDVPTNQTSGVYATYRYDISWPGNSTYSGCGATVTVTIDNAG